MKQADTPIGFSFALAKNPKAMKTFSSLPQSMQTDILQKASKVSSRAQMQALVDELQGSIPYNC